MFRLNATTGMVEITDPEVYAYDAECLKEAHEMGLPGLVTIRPKKDQFLFRIETTGALTACQVVQDTFKVLLRKLDLLKSESEREYKRIKQTEFMATV